ncbi:MAG: DUF2341 domain-containing protein, partial [Gammaproteobacteria bacterium]
MCSVPKKPPFSRLLLLVVGLVLAASTGSAYAQITLRNKTNTQNNLATSLAAAKPAGTVEGDLLIATVSHDIGTGTLGAPGAPDDWTLIEPATPGSEQMRTRSWYRVAGASEPSTYTFTSTSAADDMIVQISSYYSSSGVNAAGWTLEDKSYKYQTGLNTISTTSVTATTANLFYAAFVNDDNEAVTTAPPLNVLDSVTTSSTAQATYYGNVGAGAISESLTWGGTADETAAVAAVFSWTAAAGGGVGILFEIDHEEGDFTDYDSTVTDVGDLSVTTAAALAGTSYGLNILVDDTTAIYGQKNQTPPASNEFRLRVYLDPNGITMATNDSFQMVDAHSTGPKASVFQFRLAENPAANTYGFTLGCWADAGANWTFITISDAEHLVEIHVERAATSTSADGRCRVWIDGTLQITESAVDNWDQFAGLDYFQFGAPGSIDPGTSGTFYLDEIVLRDDGIEIGAVPGGTCPAAGQTWYNTDWGFRKALSIDQGKVTATLTDFPVLVNLGSDADLAADAQPDFDDILFTSDDGTTKLNHEIEKYNATTGELVAWVKVPTLSSTADTVLYMYYGNGTIGNQENPSGVWDANFQAVWHLEEDPSASAPQMKDSTLKANHGTSNGAMTSA